MHACGFTRRRWCESKRAEPVFVTGWKPEEGWQWRHIRRFRQTPLPSSSRWQKRTPAGCPSGRPAMGLRPILSPACLRTGAEGLTGVMRGDVSLFVDAPPMIAPQAKAGTVKVLAVTGRAREPELPNAQTVAEAGFPGVEREAWIGLVAPAQTPTEISARLGHEIAAILVAPEVQQRLAVLGFRPLIATRDEFRTLILDEHKRWSTIIREAGIKLD